ncbi:MAG: PAS domain S-box protein [Symploca sp. SIO2C1]|nr:PAS domain S-box protein [Symploca sp. SIO2C1]
MSLKILSSRLSWVSYKMPLRLVLVVPFVVQIFAVVGLTGYLSLRNGQKAVNDLANQLHTEVCDRIIGHLNSYLATPHLLNQILADAAVSRQLQTQSTPSELFLWQQLQSLNSLKNSDSDSVKILDSVNTIQLGTEQGEYLGAGFATDGSLVIKAADSSTNGDFHTYATDSQGNRTERSSVREDYDPRIRPWYERAVEVKQAVWSPIYVMFSNRMLGITISQAIEEQTGTLLGVVGTDVLLDKISQFLSSLKIGQTGQTFIIERSGLLVATSTQQQPFYFNDDEAQRLLATNSSDPLMRATAKYLTAEFADLSQINQPQQLKFLLDKKSYSNPGNYFLRVTPFQDGSGLDWLIVVVVPESDLMEQINKNTHNTILLCLGALGLATVLGVFTSRWITSPILRLSAASRAIASGELEQKVRVKGINELRVLGESFNQMAQQLRESFDELEERVEERTLALRLSEQKFALAFRASPNPIAITILADGRYIEVNDTFLEVTGYTKEEVIDHTSQELNIWVSPEDRSRMTQLLTENGEVHNQEFNFRLKSGEIRTGLLSAEIINLGGKQCLLSITNDITERKGVQEAFFESQRTLSTLMSNLPGMAYRGGSDENWTMQFVSEGCTELTGYSATDLIGNSLVSYEQLIHPEDKEFVRQEIETALAARQPFQLVYRIITITGEIKWVWEQGEGVFSFEDKLLALEGFITDITERKQAVEALAEKEQYLRLILDNIPQQVFWKDRNLVFLGCNKNWAQAAQVESPEAVVGKTDYDLLPSKEIAEEYRAKDLQIMETNQSEHFIARKEKPSEDGKKAWLDITKIPIHDSEGNVVGLLGVLEDITLRKEAEEALQAEKEKSERLLLNILPEAIVKRLKQDHWELGKSNGEALIAEQFDEVTIMFADIVGFTPLSARIAPKELVNLLNHIFSLFDQLAQKHGLEKIKTIGDAYMVAGGLPVPKDNHAEAIADMALDMQQAINQFQVETGEKFAIRIGINTGPVVAGVIGIKKFIYDLWGDTVNVASRMESQGEPGSIQVSATVYERLQDKYLLEERGAIAVKGKGTMTTYWLLGGIC